MLLKEKKVGFPVKFDFKRNKFTINNYDDWFSYNLRFIENLV